MPIRLASCAVVVLVIGLAARPSEACPGMFLPPFKLDLGLTRSESGTQSSSGSVLLVGLSRATIDPRPAAWDVGLGYVRWNAGDDTSDTIARSTSARSIADAHGAYLEVAARVHATRHLRTWLGVRGELLDADGAAFGLAARAGTELWTGANRSDGLLAFGSLAIGVYAEAGLRQGRDDVRTFTVGMTVRSPFLFVGGGPPPPPKKHATAAKQP